MRTMLRWLSALPLLAFALLAIARALGGDPYLCAAFACMTCSFIAMGLVVERGWDVQEPPVIGYLVALACTGAAAAAGALVPIGANRLVGGVGAAVPVALLALLLLRRMRGEQGVLVIFLATGLGVLGAVFGAASLDDSGARDMVLGDLASADERDVTWALIATSSLGLVAGVVSIHLWWRDLSPAQRAAVPEPEKPGAAEVILTILGIVALVAGLAWLGTASGIVGLIVKLLS